MQRFVGGEGVGVQKEMVERERDHTNAKRKAISPFVLWSVSVVFSFFVLIWTGGIIWQ